MLEECSRWNWLGSVNALITVILQNSGVVFFSVFLVVNGFTEIEKTPKCENTLSDFDSSRRHRNLNYTERSAIACHWNLTAPKICEISVLGHAQFQRKLASDKQWTGQDRWPSPAEQWSSQGGCLEWSQNAPFAQQSAHRDSRIWQLELIDSGAIVHCKTGAIPRPGHARVWPGVCGVGLVVWPYQGTPRTLTRARQGIKRGLAIIPWSGYQRYPGQATPRYDQEHVA